MSESPLTPGQIRAARQLLSWTASKLATRVGVREKTILAFELGDQWSPPLDLGLVRRRLEAAGAEFIAENGEGPSVRLQKGRETKNTTRGQPKTKIESRLSEDLSRRIDAHIAAQPQPRPTRHEAIRRLLSQALGRVDDDARSTAVDGE
jgi:DNA-binding XRE family transcriptional regulator